MFNENTLWRTSRPRGVNDVREIGVLDLGQCLRGRVFGSGRIDGDDCNVSVFESDWVTHQTGAGQQHCGTGIGDHEFGASRRLRGVNRQVRSAGEEHTQQARNQIAGAVEYDGHDTARPGAYPQRDDQRSHGCAAPAEGR